MSKADPPVTPTLAARLSDDVLDKAWRAPLKHPDASGAFGAEGFAAMRAVLVAALTPEPVRPSQDEIAWLIETMDPRFETRYYAGPVENNPLGHWCDNPSHGYRFKTQADAEAVVATFPVRRQSTYRCVEHLWMTPEPPPVVGRVFGGNKITSHDTRLFQPETPEPVCDCLPNVHYYAAPTDASCLCGNTMARASSLSPVRPTPEPVIGQNNELNLCAGCGGRGSEPLRDGLCDTCWPKYPALREPDIPSVRESDFMRAPEPVTPPITRRGRELCAACGGNGVFNTRTGVRTCERCHGDCYEATPEPVTPPVAVPTGSFVDVAARVRQQLENEPDDDPRGLAVDMIDVDRLREFAKDHPFGWWKEFADRLATQITETLSLRESLRKAEQERDALQRTYDALVARCMELPGR